MSKENNTTYVEDNVLFNKEDSSLVKYHRNNEREEYVIPKGIKIIKKEAFYWAPKKIIISEDVEKIEDGAFEINSSLQSIEVVEGNKHYKSIDGVLFTIDGKKLIKYPRAHKNKTKTYNVPHGVETIAYDAFSCVNLRKVNLPETVKYIGEEAFACDVSWESDHINLKVNIPSSVIEIGAYAFDYYSQGAYFIIPKTTKKIGEYAFGHCKVFLEHDKKPAGFVDDWEGEAQVYKSKQWRLINDVPKGIKR